MYCRRLFNQKYINQLSIRNFSAYHRSTVLVLKSENQNSEFPRSYSQFTRPCPKVHLFSRNVSSDVQTDNPALDYFNFISCSEPVVYVQNCLLNLHSSTGLPWWATIFSAALIVRAGTFPLSIFQMRNAAKLENVYAELKDKIQVLQREANDKVHRLGHTKKKAHIEFLQAISGERRKLMVRDNCHPAKSGILLLFQLPIWVSLTFAIRNLCTMLPNKDFGSQMTLIELTVGGFGWVKNLAATDPYYIIPMTMLLLNLSGVELKRLFTVEKSAKVSNFLLYFIRTVSVMMAGVSCFMPTAINLYWMATILINMLQTLLLQSPTLKRWVRTPETETDLLNPYQFAYHKLKSKFEK